MSLLYRKIKNIIRFVAQSFSVIFFYFNLKIDKKKEILILNHISSIVRSKNLNKKKSNKTKTHQEFSQNLYNLIKKKKLENFLNISFIQNMFFVHNRLYIALQLLLIRFDVKWLFYKKLILENSIGKPIRFFLYPWSSGNLIRQVYILKTFQKWSKVNLKKIGLVVEFGGGYGCMANTFFKISKSIKYIIIDLFEVSLLQFYYMSMNSHKVSFIEDSNKNFFLFNDMYKANSILKRKKIKNKLLIMNWSFSEIPLTERKKNEFCFFYYDYILICFQDKFEDINNLQYFKNLQKKLEKKKYKTLISKNLTMKLSSLVNHYYFFAKKY